LAAHVCWQSHCVAVSKRAGQYSVETTDAGLTAIDLPSGITPKATYTLTILENAANPGGAQKFVLFLLGSQGSALLKEHGLSLTQPQLAG
jgi:molybdate/tungstate transport system substrate-binding protein